MKTKQITAALLLLFLVVLAAPNAVLAAKKYSFKDMQSAYTEFDKNQVKPKSQKLTLSDVTGLWKNKHKVNFAKTADKTKKHKDWGRVAFVSPSKTDKCLKIYYFYSADKAKPGKGPEKTRVKGELKSVSCEAAAKSGLTVQYPQKL